MTNAPPLSARETTILRWADEHARGRLTSQDIRALVGNAASRVASSMARKGVLDRISRGVYLVRPLRAAAEPWMYSALAGVAHLLVDEPYYVGGPAALTLHRLTGQQYTARLDVYVRRQRRPRTIGSARVAFHVAADWAFTFGLTTVRVEGIDVHVTDPERTLLDILERVELLVGLRLAEQAVSEVLPRIDLERLVAYALRWPTASTRQRLGLLLERGGASPEHLAPLAAAVATSKSLPSMRPGRPRFGGVHPVWHVVQNDRDGGGRASAVPTQVRAAMTTNEVTASEERQQREIERIDAGGSVWEGAEDVEIEAKQPHEKVVPVRMSAEQWQILRDEAHELGTRPTTLLRVWVLERLREASRQRVAV